MLDKDYWQKLYNQSKIIQPTIVIQENFGASLSVYFYQINQKLICDKDWFFMSCLKAYSIKEYGEDCQNFAEIAEDLVKLNISQISQFNVENTINQSSAGRLAFYMNKTDILADLLQNAENCTTYFDSDLQKFIVMETSTHYYGFIYQII